MCSTPTSSVMKVKSCLRYCAPSFMAAQQKVDPCGNYSHSTDALGAPRENRSDRVHSASPGPVQVGDRSFPAIQSRRKDPLQIRRELIPCLAGWRTSDV